jgi:hypothetical protein
MAELRLPRGARLVHLTAAALVVAILGPLARPGYVLSYDMVFVPAQHLSWYLVAPADALPRAVPLDAVVAAANLAIPGWLLERLALAALIYLAALGAARLVPTDRTSIRLVAAVGYVWTPYLAERLLIGQWALLCAYAALPWLVSVAIDLRLRRRGALPRLVLAVAAGCLTPTGGALTLVAVAALLLGAVPRRTGWLALGSVVLLNLPWLVAAALSHAGGRSDPAGVDAFAARAENWSGVLGALAGTGGIWNRLTTPTSRAAAVIPVVTAIVVALAVLGWPRLRAGWPDGAAARLTWLAGGSFGLALAGATAPGAAVLRGLVAHVPGAGLLRDGQKFLIPYALLLILCAVCGVERLADRLGREPGAVVVVAALIVPVLALPDLAWGGAGALRPVSYPDDWAAVSRLVEARPGEVLPLPFAEYRQYPWNHGRVVIDPAPRYLAAPVVVDDALLVGGVVIAGEDRRAGQIRSALAGGVPAAQLGTEWVLVEGPGVAETTLRGLDLAYTGPTLTLYHNPSGRPPPLAPAGVRLAMMLAYLLALGVVMGAAGVLVAARWRRRAA